MLTLQNTDAIRRIEASIGYTFRDKRLLVQVFTRKTYMRVDPEAPDNEVLEFYGDMLMSYHVTTYFIEKFAHMLDDGLYFMRTVEQFTEMRSHYVRNQYLTDRIKQMIPNIDRLVRAQNPRLELPKDNQKAYADLFESLIGAVYLDAYRDDDLIRAFILRHLNIEPKAATEPVRTRENVTVLPSVSLPMDDDEPAVRQAVSVPAVAVPGESVAKTAEAEPVDEIAAVEETVAPIPVENALDETEAARVSPVTDNGPADEEAPIPPAELTEPDAQAVLSPSRIALNAFCHEAGYEPPIYGEAPKNAPNARPVAACTVCFRNGRGRPVKISLNDSGKTLEEATERAAAKMLKKLTEQKAAEDKALAVEQGAAEKMLADKHPTENTDTEPKPLAKAVAPAEVAASDAVEAPAEAAVPVEGTALAEPVVPAEMIAPAETHVSAEIAVEPSAEAMPSEVSAPAESVPAAQPPKASRKRGGTTVASAPKEKKAPVKKRAAAAKPASPAKAATPADAAPVAEPVTESPAVPVAAPEELPVAAPKSRSRRKQGSEASVAEVESPDVAPASADDTPKKRTSRRSTAKKVAEGEN